MTAHEYREVTEYDEAGRDALRPASFVSSAPLRQASVCMRSGRHPFDPTTGASGR